MEFSYNCLGNTLFCETVRAIKFPLAIKLCLCTLWSMRLIILSSWGLKLKIVCFLYAYLPTFNPPTQNFFWHFWKIFFFFAPFSSESHNFFPLRSNVRKKKYAIFFFPTYLPNQKIQGRVQQTNNFLRMAWPYLLISWFYEFRWFPWQGVNKQTIIAV